MVSFTWLLLGWCMGGTAQNHSYFEGLPKAIHYKSYSLSLVLSSALPRLKTTYQNYNATALYYGFLRRFAMGGDVQDKTAHEEHGHERRPSMRDKRERQSGQWDDAKHRSYINE